MLRCPASIVVGPLGVPDHDVGQTDVVALRPADRLRHQDVRPIHPKPSRQRPKLRRRIAGRDDHAVCVQRPLTGSDAHPIVGLSQCAVPLTVRTPVRLRRRPRGECRYTLDTDRTEHCLATQSPHDQRCRSAGEGVRDPATRHRTQTAREVHTRDEVARPPARLWRSRRHLESSDRNECGDASARRPTDRPIDGSTPKSAGCGGTHSDSSVRVSSRSGSFSRSAELAAVLPLPTTAASRTVVEMPADAKACATRAPVMPPPTTATAVSC